MLVKNEKQYCWVLDEVAGPPRNSVKAAIQDYIEEYQEVYDTGDSDHSYMFDCLDFENELVRVGNPYYFVPEVDGERVIDDVINYIPDEIYEYSTDYLKDIKNEHIDELSSELTKVFQKWAEKHHYKNTAYLVDETETYRIGDYIKG